MAIHDIIMAAAGNAVGLQFVGGKASAIAGTTSTTIIGLQNSTLTGGTSANASVGDYVVIAFAVGAVGTPTLTASFADGFGANLVAMTTIASVTRTDKTYDSTLLVAAGFLPSGKSTIVISGSGSVDNAIAVAIHVWKGVNSTTPQDVTATTASNTGVSDADAPAITPITANSVILAVGATARATCSAMSSSMSNLKSVASAGTNDASVAIASTVWTSGVYNPPAFTGDTCGSQESWTAVTQAIRPA